MDLTTEVAAFNLQSFILPSMNSATPLEPIETMDRPPIDGFTSLLQSMLVDNKAIDTNNQSNSSTLNEKPAVFNNNTRQTLAAFGLDIADTQLSVLNMKAKDALPLPIATLRNTNQPQQAQLTDSFNFNHVVKQPTTFTMNNLTESTPSTNRMPDLLNANQEVTSHSAERLTPTAHEVMQPLDSKQRLPDPLTSHVHLQLDRPFDIADEFQQTGVETEAIEWSAIDNRQATQNSLSPSSGPTTTIFTPLVSPLQPESTNMPNPLLNTNPTEAIENTNEENPFDNITEQLQLLVNSKKQQAQIQLSPAELGKLDIHIVFNKQQELVVNIATQNEQAQQWLDQHANKLKEYFTEQTVAFSFSQQQSGHQTNQWSDFFKPAARTTDVVIDDESVQMVNVSHLNSPFSYNHTLSLFA